MSFRLDNVTWRQYKKNIFHNLSFSIEDDAILGVNFEKYKDQKYFVKLLEGRKKIINGNIYYNDEKITALIGNDRKVKKIVLGKFRFKFIPTKFRLVSNLLINPKFLYKAQKNYLINKWQYTFLQQSQSLDLKKNLFNNINSILQNFIDTAFSVKKEWIKNYLFDIKKFNRLELEKLNLVNQDPVALETIISFCDKQQMILLNENYLEFLQALWDKLDFIGDVKFSCDCNKKLTENKKKQQYLNVTVPKLVCLKFKKILSNEIIYYRYKIWKEKQLLKSYRWQVLLTAKFNHNNNKMLKKILKEKNDPKLKLWYQLLNDFRDNFLIQQKKLISVFLTDEAINVKNKIIKLNHDFHQKVLVSKKLVPVKDKKELHQAKTKVINIINQALNKVQEEVDELDIHLNWFKWTKNFSSFDYIKFQILVTLLTKKKIIILQGIFDNLTKNEILELGELITKIKNNHDDVAIIILTKNVELIKNYSNSFLFFDKTRKYQAFDYQTAVNIPQTLDLYQKFYASTLNLFPVKYNAVNNEFYFTQAWEKLKLYKTKISLSETKNYKLAINSDKLFLQQDDFTEKEGKKKIDELMFFGKIKSIRKALIGTIVFFQTISKVVIKVVWLNNKIEPKMTNNKPTKLLFTPNAILIYDSDNGELIISI